MYHRLFQIFKVPWFCFLMTKSTPQFALIRPEVTVSTRYWFLLASAYWLLEVLASRKMQILHIFLWHLSVANLIKVKIFGKHIYEWWKQKSYLERFTREIRRFSKKYKLLFLTLNHLSVRSMHTKYIFLHGDRETHKKWQIWGMGCNSPLRLLTKCFNWSGLPRLVQLIAWLDVSDYNNFWNTESW